MRRFVMHHSLIYLLKSSVRLSCRNPTAGVGFGFISAVHGTCERHRNPVGFPGNAVEIPAVGIGAYIGRRLAAPRTGAVFPAPIAVELFDLISRNADGRGHARGTRLEDDFNPAAALFGKGRTVADEIRAVVRRDFRFGMRRAAHAAKHHHDSHDERNKPFHKNISPLKNVSRSRVCAA